MLWGGGTVEEEEKSRIDALEFRKVIVELNNLAGTPNVSDFFPVLRCFDIQGVERQATAHSAWLDRKIDLVFDHRKKL